MGNEYFWKKVTKSNNDSCWIWNGLVDEFGYGRIKYKGVQTRTHRMSWVIANGPIPDGMQINHICDVPNCVNPNHLRLGTQQENMQEKVSRNRQAKGLKNGTHTYPDRRPKGEIIGNSKLKEMDVRFIRLWLDKGFDGSELGKLFGVTKENINFIKHRKTWAHVNA